MSHVVNPLLPHLWFLDEEEPEEGREVYETSIQGQPALQSMRSRFISPESPM